MTDQNHPPKKTLNLIGSTKTDINVGSKLQKLRKSQGLSIRNLSEKSGLAVNTLSLIENGKTSPSISTLQQIAHALDVHISKFFELEAEEKSIVFTQAGGRQSTTLEGMLIEDLGGINFGENLQPLVVTLQPNSGCGQSPIVHSGQEFIYCVSGYVTYRIEKEEYLLKAGDSLLFEAHLPHCWKNNSDQITVIILILLPADKKDQSVSRHFGLT